MLGSLTQFFRLGAFHGWRYIYIYIFFFFVRVRDFQLFPPLVLFVDILDSPFLPFYFPGVACVAS